MSVLGTGNRKDEFINLFKKPLTKAKVQELKWKSEISRQSLPSSLEASGVSFSKENLIVFKGNTRRMSESDIDLNVDSYNVNPLEKEISEYSKKQKSLKKKCKKRHCNRHEKKTKIVVDDSPRVPPVKNAFSILMNARHNVIGANLEGKDKPIQADVVMNEEDVIEKKETLKKRKKYLETWSEEKGLKKRKIQEEMREEYVNKQMSKRAKRLKHLIEDGVETARKVISSKHIDNDDDTPVKIKFFTPKNSRMASVDKRIEKNDIKVTDSPSRNLRRRNKLRHLVDDEKQNSFEIVEIESDDSFERKKIKPTRAKNHAKIKIAPVFLKKKNKKVDPAVMQARQDFLQSGLPDDCLKIIEKQKILENYEYEMFPTVSHIQQKNYYLQYAAQPEFKVKYPIAERSFDDPIPKKQILHQGLFTNLNLIPEIENSLYRIANTKLVINKLKEENSIFPFKKFYRILKNKMFEVEVPSTLLWTEKYKPSNSEEIIGNTKAVKELKDVLSNWLLNKKNKVKKVYNYDSDQGDFMDYDSNSRDSVSGKTNIVVLLGPCGCGKTTAVYAIANELNFNVIEINASSVRNGKKILNDIHEATQSRHFRETDHLDHNSDTKYTLILIEDIDIVYSVADEGFLSAVNNIVTSGKRPVILTSSESKSTITQKYASTYKSLHFHALSPELLTPWLQLVCIVEDVWPKKDDISTILNLNNGDMRKTLLILQFIIEHTKINDVKNVESSLLSSNSHLFLSNCVNRRELYNSVTNTLKNLDSTAENMLDIGEFFDSISLTDAAYTSASWNSFENFPKCAWTSLYTKLSPSLSTEDNIDKFSTMSQSMFEWTHWLNVKRFSLSNNTRVENCLTGFSVDQVRSKEKYDVIYSKLLDGVPITAYLGPTNLSTDYFSILRKIAKVEKERVLTNKKRGNRFCHYLRNLNIHCTDLQLEILTKVMFIQSYK